VAPPRAAAKAALRSQQAAERNTLRNRARNDSDSSLEQLTVRRLRELREERQKLQELRKLYNHLVPFESLLQEIYLCGREWGLTLRGIVVAVASVKAALLLAIPLLLLTILTALMYTLGFFVRMIDWSAYNILRVCQIALILLGLANTTEFLIRPVFSYIYYYRQRQRLRDSQDICAVCLGGFDDDCVSSPSTACDCGDAGGPSRMLACGHRFHVDCIAPWLEVRRSCPLCQA